MPAASSLRKDIVGYRKSKVYTLNSRVILFNRDKVVDALVLPQENADDVLRKVKSATGKYARISIADVVREAGVCKHYENITPSIKKKLSAGIDMLSL